MPVPVFCCFWFQKSYTGNILGIGRDKSQCSYFYRAEAKVRKRDKDGQPGAHTTPGRGLAWDFLGSTKKGVSGAYGLGLGRILGPELLA